MKKFVLLLAALIFGATSIQAATLNSETVMTTFRHGNSFIFNESGITFSVYPDGEFDFYVDNRVNVGVGAQIGNVGITFNSGWDYNPFVQYDDYGAVIQVENVPIFYDYFGRVSQIGGVDIWYSNGFVRRVGGLNVFWNGGVFSHTTGFINIYNRVYIFRPWHRWFVRPAIGFCNVWTTPYRRFYRPIRYTWHRPYRNNIRRSYAQIGREYRFNRTRRANIYRNDRRVAVRENNGRSNRQYSRRNNGTVQRSAARSNREVQRNNNRAVTQRSNRSGRNDVQRSTTARRNNTNTVTQRSNRNRQSEVQRNSSVRRNSEVSRSSNRTSVAKRTETRTPQKRTVTKRSTTQAKPKRSVAQNRNRGTSVKRSTPQKRTVTRSTTTKRSTSGTNRTSSTRSARRL